ncbi:peptidase [Agrobacterium rhizogenes]|nr:ATP-dependent Clp protease proteolytic subunit [Rhizobium rhizogenes]OCJ23185.1 peptidase [Agrobacterium sp. B133/95]NTF57675.1 peptidase [Rhizobium rhizogenes]NTF77257.1 peptidase [Rhizobium rhizogenes]NTF96186.1 peptidase [Rhizobium rhizogenes]NTG03110.1 peptidase [Rhizobium rhizogenes]
MTRLIELGAHDGPVLESENGCIIKHAHEPKSQMLRPAARYRLLISLPIGSNVTVAWGRASCRNDDSLQGLSDMSAILNRRDVCFGLSALAVGTLKPKFVFAEEKANANVTSTAYLYFSQQIDDKSTLELTGGLINLRSQGYKTIYLMINSAGGDISSGISLYHLLCSLDVTINTYAISNVESAAILLFLAGKERVANKESIFAFHSGRLSFNNEKLTPDEINERYTALQNDDDRMKEIYKERLSISDKQYGDLLGSQLRFVRAPEALNIGLATRIGEIGMQPHDGLYFVQSSAGK